MDTATGSPTPSLRRRYVLALSFIAALSLASQVVIQVALSGNDDAGRVVNIAGRQRMLSQKIAKTALGILEAETPELRNPWIAELTDALKLWEASHDALLFGSGRFGVKGRNSPEVLALFGKLEPTYTVIRHAAGELATGAADPKITHGQLELLAKPILDNEDAFLEGMNAITFQYDKETGDRVAFTRVLEVILLLVMFVVLALEVTFIFIPGEKRNNEFFAELQTALEENRGLLRELQHRVKNTLAMITGIVSYTQSTARSPETVEALETILGRTSSLADLYSLLYISGAHSEVDAATYFAKILEGLSAMTNEARIVSLIDSLPISAAKAAPLGIAATELVTNALKYAFPDKRRGTITVSLHASGGVVELAVLDDGIGLPPGHPTEGGSGTGLTLVRELATQIGGTFRIEAASPGTRCVLWFPFDHPPAT